MTGPLRQAIAGLVRLAREITVRPPREALSQVAAAPLAAILQPTSIPHAEPDPSFPDLREFLPSGACVLDVGCGAGRNLRQLQEQGYRAIGVDVEAEALAAVDTVAPLARADLFELPLRDASVDAIVAWQMFCQFPPSRAALALAECHRVLKPQGLLVLSGCTGSGAFAGCGAQGPLVWNDPWLTPGRAFVPITQAVLHPSGGWSHARWLVLARKAAAA